MKINFFSILMAFSLAFISCSKDDTSGPVITITSPAEGSSLEKGKTHQVVGFVTDDTELAEIDLGGGIKITSFDSPTKHTLPSVTLTIPDNAPSGSTGGITITAKDKAGNVSTKRATFTVK